MLGGKNLFQKAAHQFGRTVESIQIGLYIVPQVVVLVAPMNGFLFGGGKFFFQAEACFFNLENSSSVSE